MASNELSHIELVNNKGEVISHTATKLRQYSLTGNLIAEWNSASEAAREKDLNLNKLREAGKHGEEYEGYLWLYI